MKYITTTQLVEKLQLSRTTIWRKIKDGELPAPVKFGPNNRWLESQIDEFMAKQVEAAQAEPVAA